MGNVGSVPATGDSETLKPKAVSNELASEARTEPLEELVTSGKKILSLFIGATVADVVGVGAVELTADDVTDALGTAVTQTSLVALGEIVLSGPLGSGGNWETGTPFSAPFM